MGIKALKGLTIKIGGDTSELAKSLDKVEGKCRNLSSELGQINKLLALDPNNTELLAQKQSVLADAISSTKKKLDILREAERQVQEQFARGEVSEEQYRALGREIIATERKLEAYTRAAKETAETVEDLGDKSKAASEKIDAFKTEVSEMGKAAKDTAHNGLKAVVEVAVGVIGSIVAMSEASREYCTETGKLKTAFLNAGHTAGAAERTYKSLQRILGETDQAVEAASHLAKLCATEEELTRWTQIATGVYATFGASLPVEGLTEAANETAKVGQVTGPLADALNWAAKEGETFGVVLKEATEENEAWNKAVQEAASAEDYFNLALQECSTEQERQQLIAQTLTELYGSAAAQYERTNAELIRANEATEKWNESTARLGGIIRPAITDVKEFGISLLSDAEEPLKKVSNYVRTKFLPALTEFSGWVRKNVPAISSSVAGLTAMMVAHKVATLSAKLASKGLTVATLAQAAAQKVLNAVMAASPTGLLLTAVAGVTAALAAYTAATKNAKKPVDVLTEDERELMAAADEAARAFREQKEATDEALGDITTEFDHTKDLSEELFTLADASGKVKEKDQERVNFILSELNSALGTEYVMVDGIIQQYDELKESIDQVIKAKLANSLLEAANDDYVAAIQGQTDAWNAALAAKKDYNAQQDITNQKYKEFLLAQEAYDAAVENGDHYAIEFANADLAAAQSAWESEKAILDEKQTKLDETQSAYADIQKTILDYQAAEAAALSGNYETAIDIFSRKGEVLGTYSDTVDEETGKVLATLQKNAIDLGLKAKLAKENYEKGIAGYTEKSVREAELAYYAMLDAYANAYADAHMKGEDVGDGITDGVESKRSKLFLAGRSLVRDFLAEIDAAAQSYLKPGSTNPTVNGPVNQAAAALDTYRAQEVAGQRVFRNIAEQQASRRASSQMAAAAANSGVLDQILEAVKAGQVLLLDGNALVGGTVNRMNSQLGMLQVLSERGAL